VKFILCQQISFSVFIASSISTLKLNEKKSPSTSFLSGHMDDMRAAWASEKTLLGPRGVSREGIQHWISKLEMVP